MAKRFCWIRIIRGKNDFVKFVQFVAKIFRWIRTIRGKQFKKEFVASISKRIRGTAIIAALRDPSAIPWSRLSSFEMNGQRILIPPHREKRQMVSPLIKALKGINVEKNDQYVDPAKQRIGLYPFTQFANSITWKLVIFESDNQTLSVGRRLVISLLKQFKRRKSDFRSRRRLTCWAAWQCGELIHTRCDASQW